MFTPQEFRDFFKRDFPYCVIVLPPEPQDPVDPEDPTEPVETVTEDCISTSDIERAMQDAQFFDRATCLDEVAHKTALMYLTAHYLILNLRNSTDGIDSRSEYGVASQSVGSVSVSYQTAPNSIQNNPWAKGLLETGYGKRYFDMAYQCILGNRFFIVKGRTVS